MRYKAGMGNARYFEQTLFVKLEHFAKVTYTTPEKVRARLLTFDEVKGEWSGDLAGGEQDGQWWVSSHHLWKKRMPSRCPTGHGRARFRTV